MTTPPNLVRALWRFSALLSQMPRQKQRDVRQNAAFGVICWLLETNSISSPYLVGIDLRATFRSLSGSEELQQ